MLEIVFFVYSNEALTAALTIGFWVGMFPGALGGALFFNGYLKLDIPRGNSLSSVVRRYVVYTASCALLILTVSLGVFFGSVLGALLLFLAWVLLLPSLVGGVLCSMIYSLRRHMVAQRAVQGGNSHDAVMLAGRK
jgi:hypothetical protein